MKLIRFVAFPVLALSLGSAPLAAQNLIVNGGFEAGLAGWSVVGTPSGGPCQQTWQAAAVGGTPGVLDYNPGTGCMGVGGPYAGALSAYNSFDGAGPLSYLLTQIFFIPGGVTEARLRFQETIRHAMFDGADAREFNVFVISGTGAINPFSYASIPGGDFNNGLGHGWTGRDLDITAFAMANAGSGAALVFEVMVPESFTGPAGMGLDEVSLDVRMDGQIVPEPASIVLVASGLLFVGGVAARRRSRAA